MELKQFEDYDNILASLLSQIDVIECIQKIEKEINKIIEGKFEKEKEFVFLENYLYEMINSIYEFEPQFKTKTTQLINNFFRKCLDLIFLKIEEENKGIAKSLSLILNFEKKSFYNSQEEDDFNFKKMEKRENYSKLKQENIEYFGRIRGFEKIICFILSKDHKLNSEITYYYLNSIIQISENFSEEFYQKISNFLQSFLEKLIESENEEIKSFTKNKIEEISSKIFKMIKKTNKTEEERKEYFEFKMKFENEISIKYLKTSSIPLKIEGIKKIQQKISIIKEQEQEQKQNESFGFNSNYNYSNPNSNSNYPKIDKELFISWFDSKNIIEIIFGKEIHQEIIKQSKEIILFLKQNNLFSKNQFIQILDKTKKQDQNIKESIFEILFEILKEFKEKEKEEEEEELINKLFSEIEENKEWTINLIKLIKDFSIQNLTKINFEKLIQEENQIENLIQEEKENEIEKRLKPIFLMNKLIIDSKIEKRIEEKMIERIELIEKNNQKLSNFLLFIKKIINYLPSSSSNQNNQQNYYNQKTKKQEITKEKFIEKLKEKYKIEEIIINSIISIKNKIKNEIENEIFENRTYLNHVETWIDFLEIIQEKQIEKFWEIFFEKSLIFKEKELFIQFFSKIIENEIENENENENENEIFFIKLNSISKKQFTKIIFENWKKLFIKINSKNKNKNKIIGKEELWEIILETENEEIYKLSIDFLIDFQHKNEKEIEKEIKDNNYNYIDNDFENERKEENYPKQFISECISRIEKEEKKEINKEEKEKKIYRFIIILKKYIERNENKILRKDLPFERHYSTLLFENPKFEIELIIIMNKNQIIIIIITITITIIKKKKR
ncbi:hypothetical protein M0811_01129 [Anaeramoeba ignava]|uniref:Uncharacterized protein n=1 Tax=Anaeramoeba ignava TaxID=1746090 RepID=A0A9Q0LN77_ANAIG|nr:hypothetical protein M0811_01129 [Anaeramoeba ignava]